MARPVAIEISLLGSQLSWQERLTAGWFGPKGFASVVYGVMVFRSKIPGSNTISYIIAAVIVGSILAHSSTDVPIARWFKRCQQSGSDPLEAA